MNGLTIGSVKYGLHNGKPAWIAQASYTDEDGRRRFVRGVGATERQALQRRQANISKRAANPTRVSPTVRDLFDEWISRYGPNDIRETTLREYRGNIERHILPHLSSVQIVNLDTERLQRLFSHDLSSIGGGARTNAFKILRHMIVWAVNNNKMPSNPLRAVKLPDYTTVVHADDEKLIDKRTNVAIQLLDWLSQPDCPYHDDYNRVLFSFLGLRRGELLGMTWDCATNLGKPGKGNLRVRQQLQRSADKGWHIYPATKNGKIRTIPLPEIFRKALLDERKKDRFVTVLGAKSNLVWAIAPNKHFTYNDYNNRWREILTAYWNRNNREPRPLAPDNYWRPHANRHLTASIMFRAGETLEYVVDVLGHSDEIMTLWYTHFSKDAKRDMMNTYGDALSKEGWNAIRRKENS